MTTTQQLQQTQTEYMMDRLGWPLVVGLMDMNDGQQNSAADLHKSFYRRHIDIILLFYWCRCPQSVSQSQLLEHLPNGWSSSSVNPRTNERTGRNWTAAATAIAILIN